MAASGFENFTRTMAGSKVGTALPLARSQTTLASARDTVIVTSGSPMGTPLRVAFGSRRMTAPLPVDSVVTVLPATATPEVDEPTSPLSVCVDARLCTSTWASPVTLQPAGAGAAEAGADLGRARRSGRR